MEYRLSLQVSAEHRGLVENSITDLQSSVGGLATEGSGKPPSSFKIAP